MKIANSTQIEKDVKEYILKHGIYACSSARVAYILFDILRGMKGRPVIQSGRGKWSHKKDYGVEVKNILLLHSLQYECGNDAPRGGRCGVYIRLLSL